MKNLVKERAKRVEFPGKREPRVSETNQDVSRKGRLAINKTEKQHSPTRNQINSIATDIATLNKIIGSAGEKLDSLPRRLVMVVEEERRACGEELHDQIGQDLTLLNLAVAQASRTGGRVDWPSIQKMVSQILFKVRHFSLSLYGVDLDQVSLDEALRSLVQTIREKTGLGIEMNLDEIAQTPPEEVGITCYRLVQEALTNVLRYSGADRVKVEVWEDKDNFNVQVVDNGVGFNPGAAYKIDGAKPEAAYKTGGLSMMRRRVEMVGGTLDISSHPGGGTMLLAAFPLRAFGT